MSNLKIRELALKGSYEIISKPFVDERGMFARFFCSNELKDILQGKKIVNVNFSQNINKGAIRGLHFQPQPYAEIKMPRCIKGKILDIIVDVRKDSPTFLKSISVELSAKNMKMLFVPEGFAHGFQSLENDSQIIYFTTQFFSSGTEMALNIKDPRLGIKLPIPITQMSDRDLKTPFINEQKFKGITL